MDYEKYYKLDYEGIYHLHFYNKDRLDLAEVKKIFSNFGKVQGVNFSGVGLVFVRYNTLEEVITCFNGLKDNNRIQLLPERSKINKNMDKNSTRQQEGTGNSFQKTFRKEQPLNSNSIHDKNFSNVGESSTHVKISNENNRHDNVSDTNYHNPTHKSNQNITRDNESDSSVFNKKSLPLRRTSVESNSSDTAMDCEKYYRLSKDEGSYTVHFVNKGFTEEEIKKLFEPYGNVLAIRPGGLNNIFRIVRYETREEVIRCIKGLRSSNVIALLPQKDKVMNEMKTTGQGSLNPWQTARTENTSQTSTGKQFNTKSNDRFSETGEKAIHNEMNKKTHDLDKLEDNDYFSGTASHISRQGYKFNKNKYKNLQQLSSEKYSSSRQFMNNEDDRVMKPNKAHETDIKMDRNIQINTYDYKVPALISDTETKSNEFDTMSDHSLSNGTRNSLSKTIVPMQEIIVANIHSNYGVHYILHLFEKHRPISATLVKTIPEKDIRYCHIYFKTMQDAIAVEEEFDNLILCGKNLIVLRNSRLIDETIRK